MLARLITRTGLDLVGARLFAPSPELVREYANVIVSSADPQDRKIQELIRDYTLRNFGPDPRTQKRRRVMMFLFRGEEAVRKIRSVVGTFSAERRSGETIRDTFGDLIFDEKGQVSYFEPAALAAPTAEETETKLKLWARFSDSDGGFVDQSLSFTPEEKVQRTLVLIKPENFRFPTGRPGNVIDFLSRTGLYIVAIKVHRMSVAQAMEFYGPVREALRTKLKDVVATRAKNALEREFGYKVPAAEEKQLGEMFAPLSGDAQFEYIVKYMSGSSPSECPSALLKQPGSEKCIALVYEGVEAVRKIRDVLGPTDPSKAPPGSIRREFGQNITVNAAHASDSEENAAREMKIINIGENTFRSVVDDFYSGR